ncbi:C4-dicarboxylate TRAP transporter substrate-binding protein [Corynebacterium sp. A21]|uniref:C4-dicarboxylate TRAP transporter substrate-binding protein n=1 Tax=Corynebacterium sp. A21 TaxID=3457318 RepID=UPI003FD1B730
MSTDSGDVSNASASGEQTLVKANPPYGPDHMMSTAMTQFADIVSKDSDGQLAFEHYFADSLVKQPEVATSLDGGVIDLGYLGMAYTPASFPIDAWAAQLGYGSDERPVVGLLASAAATVEWAYTVPELSAELEDAGSYPLIPRFQNHDNYQLLCKQPVESLADAAGKRVRVGGELYADAVESLGMTPVTLSGAEIYEGFERGVVDCFVGAEPDMTGLGLWEIGKNFTKVDFPGWNSISLASGTSFMNSLNEEQKSAFDENRAEFMQIYYEGYFNEQKRFHQNDSEMELEIIQPEEDLQKALDDHFAGVRENMITNAPASIEDPEAAVLRFEELRDKWTKIVVDLGYDKGYATHGEWAKNLGEESIDLEPWSDKLDEEIFSKLS